MPLSKSVIRTFRTSELAQTTEGLIVRLAEVELAEVAEIEAVTCEPTELVVTVNVPDDAPCAIVIDAGTVAEALFEPRLTSTPPTPAGEESCTVPVEGDPPVTDVGESVSDEIAPVPGPLGSMVRLAEVEFAEVAEIDAVTCEPTELVVSVNVPEDAP